MVIALLVLLHQIKQISRPSEQQHHHKESNLLGAQELTTKKGKSNGNSSSVP
jgi:hypothetical protein